jgi:peroxiredoxin Q/BCP
MRHVTALAVSVVCVAGVVACSTTSALVAAGAPAPAFSAPDQSGSTRTSGEFVGKPLVVFFYPKDGTPGCTAEACAFRDAWKRYEAAGVNIVGISTDDVASHKAFADEHKLPYPLLSDTDGTIAKAWGVDVTFTMAKRVSFLVGADGVVKKVFPDVDPGVHAKEILDAAKGLSPQTSTPTPETANMAPPDVDPTDAGPDTAPTDAGPHMTPASTAPTPSAPAGTIAGTRG